MRRFASLVVVFTLLTTLSACSKSEEQLLLERKAAIAIAIYDEKSTWDSASGLDTYDCSISILKGRLFKTWSYEIEDCVNEINNVVTVVSRVSPMVDVDAGGDALISRTKEIFGKIRSINYCDESEWNSSPASCEAALDESHAIEDLGPLLDEWYAFKATL